MKLQRDFPAQLLDGKALGSLVQVNNGAAAFVGDHSHRLVQHVAAFTRSGAEDISRKAMRVHPHQCGEIAGFFHFALHQRNMRLAVDLRLVGNHAKVAVTGWNDRLAESDEVGFRLQPVTNEFGHGQHLHLVLPAEFFQLRHPGHGAVVIHDLADDARRNESCHAGQVDGSLSLSSAHEHAALASAQGKDVSGTGQIAWARRRIDSHLDGLGAVEGRDAGRDAVARIDRFSERGAEVGSVLGTHGAEPKLVQPLLRHRQADQATTMLRHKVDRLRGDFLCGHGQVAFVFAVFVVHDDDHSTGANFFNRGRHVTELRLLSHRR